MEIAPSPHLPSFNDRSANNAADARQEHVIEAGVLPLDAAHNDESDPALGQVASVEVVGRSGVRGQGPFMEITLVCAQSRVERADFETYGCPSAIRCGDWVVKWALGREVKTLWVLEPEIWLWWWGGLPLGKEFCAEMAVLALRNALYQIAGDADSR